MFHVPKVHCVLIISVHFANSHLFCLNKCLIIRLLLIVKFVLDFQPS